jgi:hypothetical protein
MLTKQGLYTLLDLDVSKKHPNLVIYAEQSSERLDYVCEFIFNHVLGINYKLTTDTAYFNESKDIRINYSSKNMGSLMQIYPDSLLDERNITEEKPVAVFESGMLYFYKTSLEDYFPYDVFSAVFYFISRYEEWQYYEPDNHERFEVKSSILYKNGFHMKPVLDIWILELVKAIRRFYPEFTYPEKQFKILSTIDVDNLYAFKAKGLFRTLGASIKDILKGDLKNLKERIQVLRAKRKDPFDIYASVSDFCFEKKIPLVYFFLFRTGTRYDRTVNPESPVYQTVFKTLKENQALMGLHPSYNAAYEKGRLSHEISDLSQKSGQRVSISRQHYLRFDIRSTPGLLQENGILADFTMGFASSPGFRAGTSHPFYYYDFNKEKKSELLFVPFCVMDGAYTVYEKNDSEQAYYSIMELAQEIKKVNGIFVSVFHERSFYDHLYPGFGTLYKKLHSALKEL